MLKVLAVLANKAPGNLIIVFEKCMAEETFPTRWKKARLMLLHKGPDKPVENASSFRLLCMLDTAGKLFERILLQGLNDHLDSAGGLSPNQFGFRRGRSIEDAISKVLETANWARRGNAQY